MAGRSALDSLRSGRAQYIDKPGQVFSPDPCRGHRPDLRASMAEPISGL
jgi:hypothetical protein